MPNITNKDKFFQVLRDIFIGAKIEGNSGYVNIMKVKNLYYNEFKHQLQRDINDKLTQIGQAFEEEMYNKLYTFFKKYFSDSGAIYFNYTHLQDKIYERIYREDKDVALFWKTNMLYYVKTERLFKDMTVQDDMCIYHFDVQNLEHKKNNEKKELIFELQNAQILDTNHVYFTVHYAKNGAKTKIDDITKKLKKHFLFAWAKDTHIEKAIAIFKKQTEVDYFINKDAKLFLTQQFDMWLKTYLLDDETIFQELRLKQLKALQHIAHKIIDLVSQFEDELVKVWNKPKFAHSSNYVITLDKIILNHNNLLQTLLKHPNISQQITEWQQLGMITDNFDLKNLYHTDLIGTHIADAYKYLPFDTKYFKDMELQLLNIFENLDDALDGWLIHSENYQALNTIKHKFKEKIQTIYIDPPYNTKNEDFIYKDTYKHASWLSFIENRLQLARMFLRENGAIFVSLDDNEQASFKLLCDSVFGNENFIASIIWYSKYTVSNDAKYVSYQHENINFYAKNINSFEIGLFNRTTEHNEDYKNRDNDPKGRWKATPLHAKSGTDKSLYTITFDNNYSWSAPKGRYPRYSQRRLLELYEGGELYFNKNGGVDKKTYLSEVKQGITVGSVWQYEEVGHTHSNNEELAHLVGKGEFDNPKGTKLIEKIASVSKLENNDIILDFFGGSGTTAHAVIELNKKDGGERKYLLAELGSHFDTVIVPRLKKVAFSDKWKEGKAQQGGKGASQFFKYFALEQYEETLAKAAYADNNATPTQDIYHQYLFLKDLKLSPEVLHVDTATKSIKVDLTKLHKNIDIPETLSHLLGKFIKQIKTNEVIFTDNTSIDLTNIDYKLIRPLIWW